MIDRKQFHPALRQLDDSTLEHRKSQWGKLFTPAADRIHLFGDCQLYCRDADYQNVLDNVPCVTGPQPSGYGRICLLAGADLDRWREQVRRWLSCFDEQGQQIQKWVPLDVPVTVEPTITVGRQPPKRAPWFGTGLKLWMKRGKPD